MGLKKHEGGWTTRDEATLTKKDLKEGQVYRLPYLTKDGTVLVNECVYAVIDGEIVLHRSANWEDIPTSNTTKEAFLLERDETLATLPDSIPCFVSLEKVVG